LNTNLGYYTNFVNLLDLAAVAVPAGVRASGLPFGVSLIGPAFSEQALLCLADRFHRAQTEVPGDVLELAACPPGCIAVAVVGAHLSGQPLNHELCNRQARLVKTCRTAPGYRLYALDGTIDFICEGGGRFRHEVISTKLSPGRSRCNVAARVLLFCIGVGFMIFLPLAPSQCNLSYGSA